MEKDGFGLTKTKIQRAELGVFFRARDAQTRGLSFRDLERGIAAGELEKYGAGLYRLAAAEPSEQETLAMVCAAVPTGIVCLLSALSLYRIGTQSPSEVWLAIDRKARKPTRLPARVRFVRFSGAMLNYGVVTREILGIGIRITTPARTVVDCFRYRNKLGLDVALEALREAVSMRKATIDEINRAAEVGRARRVMQPFLEALPS